QSRPVLPWNSLEQRPRPRERSAGPHPLLWARTWQKQGRIQFLIAFSSEVDAGSLKENASKHKVEPPLAICLPDSWGARGLRAKGGSAAPAPRAGWRAG